MSGHQQKSTLSELQNFYKLEIKECSNLMGRVQTAPGIEPTLRAQVLEALAMGINRRQLLVEYLYGNG